MIRSEGENDENLPIASVQIDCINIFFENDLDFVIYLVTTTAISHVHEVEGFIPVANLVLSHQDFDPKRMNNKAEEFFARGTSSKKSRIY